MARMVLAGARCTCYSNYFLLLVNNFFLVFEYTPKYHINYHELFGLDCTLYHGVVHCGLRHLEDTEDFYHGGVFES